MNPTAIYSKSGKGVQEASGKTSLLKRPDRAVLSAIDGRATLAEVAQKVGKTFDAEFQKLVTQLDKDGFIREVSPGAASAGAKPAGPAAKAPPPKPGAPGAPMDAASDLDFSSFAPAAKPASAAPPSPRPGAPASPAAKAPPPKEQQTALNKAREEAEGKAQAERDRIKAETEAKMRAEMEAKARVETEAKMKAEAESKAKSDSEAKQRADTEAKIKAARDAAVRTAAEAKMKSDAESRRVREEADKAKRESEDLKQRLEEERKAREEAERRARDEGERARKELEGERRKIEEEGRKAEEERAVRRKREEDEEQERRKKREEEERKAEEERAARRKREEEEEKSRQKKQEEEKKKREEEDRKAEDERAARRKRLEEEEERKAEEERVTRRKKREEEEALARATEEEERRIRAEEVEAERQRRATEEEDRRKSEAQKSIAEVGAKPATPAAPAAPAKPAAGGGGFDSLLADLDSFGKKDEEEAKAKEESERKAKQEAARRAEEAARQEREEGERRASEERAAQRKRDAEEEERKAEEERSARRKKREEEDRREEEERKAEEKKRRERDEAEAQKAKGKKAPAKPADDDDIPAGDDDMDDVKRDQRLMAGKKKEKAYVAPPTIAPSARRRPANWGKPVAIGLILLLAVAVGVVHVLPLGTAEYERAASEAIGRPVKIASGRIWLFTGLQLKLQGVTVGDNVKIANVTAYPTFDTLSGDRKTFTRIDLDGVVMPQQALGEALFAKAKGDKFTVARVVARQIELTGPLTLPKGLEADIAFDAEGAPRTITVRGPDTLVAKLTPKDSTIEFDVNAGGFMIPIAPEVTLGNFAMKGVANRQGMSVAEWDGALLNGTLRGTANVRWGSNWTADGVVTARGINAAVFAPALVSEGRGEGTAKFTMSGPEPAKLGANGRYDGSFKVESGALGSVDLSLALKTSGRQTAGRTSFNDMTGQVTYDRGTVSARNIQISAGALNAGASADITREGALSGRIVADVKVGSQNLRSTLNLGGTAKDPQFRN